jgi:hypothetical protein
VQIVEVGQGLARSVQSGGGLPADERIGQHRLSEELRERDVACGMYFEQDRASISPKRATDEQRRLATRTPRWTTGNFD